MLGHKLVDLLLLLGTFFFFATGPGYGSAGACAPPDAGVLAEAEALDAAGTAEGAVAGAEGDRGRGAPTRATVGGGKGEDELHPARHGPTKK